MGTNHAEIFQALAREFRPNEVKQRSQGGRQLNYVTASTVANRLDSVLGPENWDFELSPWGQEALIGTLVVRLPDGTVVRKSNVGGKADMQASDDEAKSAASDCLKRCASLLGVARYLYRDGVAEFTPAHQVSTTPTAPANGKPANGHTNGKHRTEWPGKGPGTAGVATETHAPDCRRRRGANSPETGGQLYAWVCQTQRKLGRGGLQLLPALNHWAKAQGYPGRMSDWSGSQVAEGYAEACRLLEQAE